MKRLVTIAVVLAVIVGGIGFYRGWFSVASDRDSKTDNVDVNLTIDTEKVRDDSDALKEKAQSLTDKVTE